MQFDDVIELAFIVIFLICTAVILWGCSSIGRAPALHAGGRRFESGRLHPLLRSPYG